MTNHSSVFFSYGMGVDSTAILLRWLHESSSRGFNLDELVVLTAMTGDEWSQTGQMVRELVLPLMRAHHIRYIQLARAGPKQADGVRVLDDSRSPTQLFIDGAYTLAEEMLTAGTVPQCGGGRRCSAKAKGWPLEQVIGQIAAGRPYRHIMGFELNELNRATRDATFNTAQRTGRYPLIEWEWNRRTCEDCVFLRLGVRWPKSACTYCPFALSSVEGRARTLERFAAEPSAGVGALFMEHVAVALNPRQGLIAGARLYDVLAATPGLQPVLVLLEERLNDVTWAVYYVRRALLPSARHPDRPGTSARELHAVVTGNRAAMRQALGELAAEHGVDVDTSDPRHPRMWLRRRNPGLPTTESFYAIAPHTAVDKTAPGFAAGWSKATTSPPSSFVVIRAGTALLARLELVCKLITCTLDDAASQALEEWIAPQVANPDVRNQAMARLEAEEQALQKRRDLLLALADEANDEPNTHSTHTQGEMTPDGNSERELEGEPASRGLPMQAP